MNTAEMKLFLVTHNLLIDCVSKKGNVFTFKRSYFQGTTKSGEEFAERIASRISSHSRFKAKVADYGNHFHAFVGGAKAGSPKDSYLWTKIELTEVTISDLIESNAVVLS